MSQLINKYVLKTFVLCLLINISASECPQVSFDSLLVGFCNTKQQCLDRVVVLECISPETLLEDVSYVEITGKLHILRRGFVHDLSDLKRVIGYHNNIIRINSGALLNLPGLEEVSFIDSRIGDVVWGVFNNMSMSMIDLSRNFISLVENEAFSHMPNLKSLNLEMNRLETFQNSWLLNSYNLENISLAYNKIYALDEGTFGVFPKLKQVDISFNVLTHLDSTVFDNNKLKLVDFTGNQLWRIPKRFFGNGTKVTELRVPLNYLGFLDTEALDGGHISALVLHPNPWHCSCLEEVLAWMRDHKATLKNVAEDARISYQDDIPECSASHALEFKDTCVKRHLDELAMSQDTYFGAVNYTNWYITPDSSDKQECLCD